MLGRSVWIAGLLFLLVPAAGAAGVDGSKPMLCAVTEALECGYEAECSRGSVESLNIPPFLRVDPKARTLSEYKGSRTTPVETVMDQDGQIVLQGFETRAFSVSISKATGKLVATATGPDVGFVLFGICTDL